MCAQVRMVTAGHVGEPGRHAGLWPGAVALLDGRVQVYALGMDGALWYRTYDVGDGWAAGQVLATSDGVAVEPCRC